MKKSFLTDLFNTFITHIIIVGSGVLILKILSGYLIEDEFGIYLMMRRVLAVGLPILSLNLGMGLSRYISLSRNEAHLFLLLAIGIVLVLWLLCIPPILIFADVFSSFLFGKSGFSYLIFPLWLLLLASSIQSVSVGYFRGKRKFDKMNILNMIIWIFALGIILFYMIFEISSAEFLFTYFIIYSIIILLVDGYFIIRYYNSHNEMNTSKNNLLPNNFKEICKGFVKYGISRLPSGFLFALIFFIPMAFASNSLSLTEVAYIGIVVSIMRLLQVFSQPINMILIPKFAHHQSLNNHEAINYYSRICLEYIITIPFLIGFFTYFYSHEIIYLWFGNKYAIVAEYLIILAPFLGLYLGYFLIRGILDGLYDFPYVNIINFAGMIFTGLFSYFSIRYNWGVSGLAASLALGSVILGLSSIYILLKKQHLNLLSKKNLLSFGWISLIFLLFLTINEFLHSGELVMLLLKIIITIMILPFTFIIFQKINMDWPKEVIVRLKDSNS
jgi:O-antigen/teichoic acid export membrane protein